VKSNRVAEQLRAQEFAVFNPAENDDGGVRHSRAFYMRLDIPALMASDGVVVLPGWERSRGASLEVWIALDLDLPVFRCADVGGLLKLQRIESIGPPMLPFAGETVAKMGSGDP